MNEDIYRQIGNIVTNARPDIYRWETAAFYRMYNGTKWRVMACYLDDMHRICEDFGLTTYAAATDRIAWRGWYWYTMRGGGAMARRGAGKHKDEITARMHAVLAALKSEVVK